MQYKTQKSKKTILNTDAKKTKTNTDANTNTNALGAILVNIKGTLKAAHCLCAMTCCQLQSALLSAIQKSDDAINVLRQLVMMMTMYD